jgi:hypothetical protein
MPKFATELTQGQSFSRTAENAAIADAATRAFKVILSSPGETFDPQAFCGTFVGSRHPTNINLVCSDFNAKFDGDSRMVAIITFNYRSNLSVSSSSSQRNPKQQHPRQRPASWTTSSSLVEVPAYVWRSYTVADEAWSSVAIGDWSTTTNPNAETYEGVTMQASVTDIRITQLTDFDPMSHHAYASYINSIDVQLGSLLCRRHSLLVRSVDVEPTAEPFMGEAWNGYKVTYSLSYKKNVVTVPRASDKTTFFTTDIGWDRLQVVEGYKIKNSGLGSAGVDQAALALKQVNCQLVVPSAYADGTQDTVCAAQVVVSGRDGGKTQVRASGPVALNADGTPRDLTNLVNGKYLAPNLVRYQVQPDADLRAIFGLRLTG